jgi:hypothetical protein
LKLHVVNPSNLNIILNKDFRTHPTMLAFLILCLWSTYVSITRVGLFNLNTESGSVIFVGYNRVTDRRHVCKRCLTNSMSYVLYAHVYRLISHISHALLKRLINFAITSEAQKMFSWPPCCSFPLHENINLTKAA